MVRRGVKLSSGMICDGGDKRGIKDEIGDTNL